MPQSPLPPGSGRSAACKPCNITEKCVCLVQCGHTSCTGGPSLATPSSWPKRLGIVNNPGGRGGLRKGKPGVEREPPRYDGPGSGKGKTGG